MGLFTTTHQRVVDAKQQERRDRIKELVNYNAPLTGAEQNIVHKSAEYTISKVHEGSLKPSEVLLAYGKRAIECQKQHNSITEIMIKDAEKWAETCDTKGPLAGFPISMKDTVGVAGYDSCIGYSKMAFKPFSKDTPMIRMLKDAGALPFVKTNVPYTLLSFESYNDVWGTSENPHVHGYVPGGSTGGEAALLAFGGSRLGIGTDVAGSVRYPAHVSGIYALKCSTGRFPKAGNFTSMPGQEGVPAVYSPMCRTLKDLHFFTKTITDLKPWEYDYSVHPMPWKEVELPKKCRVGVMFSDGIAKPTPACQRALDMTIDALEKQGHEIVDFQAPSPLKCLRIASQLLCSDGAGVALRNHACGEQIDVGVDRIARAARLPRWMKRVYAWFLEHIVGDKVWATLVRDWNIKKIEERWDLVYEREGYKSEYFEAWKAADIDFMISVPNSAPALPHRGLYEAISACGYTFMFNLLDYSAGVLPVTKVDGKLDRVDPGFKPSNRVERGAYSQYDAVKMDGLPVGIQVVCGRLQEEKCLKAMELVESSLVANGVVYELMNEVD